MSLLKNGEGQPRTPYQLVDILKARLQMIDFTPEVRSELEIFFKEVMTEVEDDGADRANQTLDHGMVEGTKWGLKGAAELLLGAAGEAFIDHRDDEAQRLRTLANRVRNLNMAVPSVEL